MGVIVPFFFLSGSWLVTVAPSFSSCFSLAEAIDPLPVIWTCIISLWLFVVLCSSKYMNISFLWVYYKLKNFWANLDISTDLITIDWRLLLSASVHSPAKKCYFSILKTLKISTGCFFKARLKVETFPFIVILCLNFQRNAVFWLFCAGAKNQFSFFIFFSVTTEVGIVVAICVID